MAKLQVLRSTIGRLPSTIAFAPQDDKERDRFRDQQHWRKWYRTARWKRLRWATLLRDRFTCQRCGRLESNTSKLVADHVKPHRGDERLFWDGELVTLCSACHSGEKQRLEKSGALG